MGIREKLKDRPSALHISPEQEKILDQAFAGSDWEDLYLFHDGHVEEGSKLRGRSTSRTAQLVSIQIDGIPMNVSRKGFAHWKTHPPTTGAYAHAEKKSEAGRGQVAPVVDVPQANEYDKYFGDHNNDG